MPDITMCIDHECPQNHNCYRYKAEPSQRQAYFVATPRRNGECEMYWAMEAPRAATSDS